MQKRVRFEAGFHLRGQPGEIGELMLEKVAELKHLYPGIDEVRVEDSYHDRTPHGSAGYKAHLDGVILFQPGFRPDLERLTHVGEECFGYENFRLLPMMASSAGDSTLEVHCRVCGCKIGDVADHAALAAAGKKDQIEERVDGLRREHLRQKHAEIDPGTL
jgi:hypothetical protein